MCLLTRPLIVLLIAIFFALPASALELAPYKDAEFAYPGLLGETANPLDLTIDYREIRDINDRDEVPERRVKRAWVSAGVKRQETDLKLETSMGTLHALATGKREAAGFIVVYLHGKGGNRRQGQNDYTFGGNFNRVRNLAAKNGGLYVTPDFTDFGEQGAKEVRAIIERLMVASPEARLVLACGSMGGLVCHRLAVDESIGPQLDGVLFLGSFPDDAFVASKAVKRGMPVFIGHGTNDKSSPIAGMETFAGQLRAAGGAKSVMIHRFNSGAHGTPVRMADWRLVLNWMLKR